MIVKKACVKYCLSWNATQWQQSEWNAKSLLCFFLFGLFNACDANTIFFERANRE